MDQHLGNSQGLIWATPTHIEDVAILAAYCENIVSKQNSLHLSLKMKVLNFFYHDLHVFLSMCTVIQISDQVKLGSC